MSDTNVSNLIDRSVKQLFRDQPQALLHLLGIEAAIVRFEDANLNIPELRADHVFIVEEEGEPNPWAVYVEYQLRPDPDLLVSWGLKTIFREELAMLDMDENLKLLFLETGKLQRWLRDPQISGELQAEAKAEGKEEGKAEGKAEAVREMTLAYLTRRFNPLPKALVAQINTADADWCQRLFDRAMTVNSLADLTGEQ